MSPLSVLIVEDHEDGAAATANMLRLYGYEVAIARTGAAALAEAAEREPDVVLLDIRLPDIDGWEVARRIAKQQAPSKIPLLVAITGCATDLDRLKSNEAGINLHLAKPVEPGVLIGMLERLGKALAANGSGEPAA
jgi:CheY-like chemotaxis protein